MQLQKKGISKLKVEVYEQGWSRKEKNDTDFKRSTRNLITWGLTFHYVQTVKYLFFFSVDHACAM